MNTTVDEIRTNIEHLSNLSKFKKSILLKSPISTGSKDSDIKFGDEISLEKYYKIIKYEYDVNVNYSLLSKEFISFLELNIPLIESDYAMYLKRLTVITEEFITEYNKLTKRVEELEGFKEEFETRFKSNEKLVNYLVPFYQKTLFKLKQMNDSHIKDYEILMKNNEKEIMSMFDSADDKIKKELKLFVDPPENSKKKNKNDEA